MQLDLDNLPNNTTLSADFCIVGTGPSGMSVLSKLIKLNKKIILLESGDLIQKYRHEILNEGFSTGPRELDLINSRSRRFGGFGSLWAGKCGIFSKEDFEIKKNSPLSGWPISYDEINIYYKEACDLLNINYLNFSLKKKFKSDDIFYKLLNNKNSLLEGQDFPHANEERKDISNKFRKTIIESKKINLITNATVVDLIQNLDNDNINSLKVLSINNKSLLVNAKFFILSLGGIENPRFILNSSLKEKFKQNNYLGNCFMSHPGFGPTSSIIETVNMCNTQELKNYTFGINLNPAERKKLNILNSNISIYPLHIQKIKKKKNLQNIFDRIVNNSRYINTTNQIKCFFKKNNIENKYWNTGIGLEQEPRKNNKLFLSNQYCKFGKKKINIYWDKISHLEQKTVIDSTMAVGRQLKLTNKSLQELNSDLMSGKIFDQQDPINHHIGTTRMANNFNEGVVDKNLKFFGINNLYLSGSSVFPTSGNIGPTFTIIALSLRLGDHLSKKIST
jgi:hypothetical protein